MGENKQPPQEQKHESSETQVDSEQNETRRRLAALFEALADLKPPRVFLEEPDEQERQPTSAADFVDAIQRLHNAGFSFDESGRLLNVSAPAAGHQQLRYELQERFPYLPSEVEHLVFTTLTGRAPDPELVGDEHDVKREAVQRWIITEELRERFFLRDCGKVPRFVSLD